MTVNRKKSSKNNITGDVKTTRFETIIYCLNFFRELINSKKYSGSEVINQNKEDLFRFWSNEDWEDYSPARIACDMFIVNYLFENFTIGETINLLDVGCGRGHYSTLFRNLGFEINYIGIDIEEKDSWEILKNENTRFYKAELGEGNKRDLEGINNSEIDLVFSHSCLEHIKNDISALIEINELVPQASHLHLVPATISFFNYFKHGFRRYSERNFLEIAKYVDYKIKVSSMGCHFLVSSYFNFFYKKYKRKHKFDLFNLYKKNVGLDEILLNISPKKGNYPVYFALEIKK